MDANKMIDLLPAVKVEQVNSYTTWKQELAFILLKKENWDEK